LEFLKRYPLSKKAMASPDLENRFRKNAAIHTFLNVAEYFQEMG